MQIAFHHLSRLSLSFVTLCRSFGGEAAHKRSHAAKNAPAAVVHPIELTGTSSPPPATSPRSAGRAAPQGARAASARCTRPPVASRASIQPARTVRVLRKREGSAEHLAIVGRMADVCAELDRLAARERLC
ncbi:hypothetical protein [Simplicispira suum]|uniref:Uncharacterized protein n=1 Tax=Simplicispira suum TaxID=2109915 RepID=A0A2S0N3A5_9BURK|nr:hypothetical protein [Simplicispira suum]AVO42517.1 hypothetical protein C6571_15540 [Simplicispira suum]MBW7833567.1 hypothetical protein [Simplicispira suum]